MEEQRALTEEEEKEIRRRRRALKKKRMEKKKAQEQKRMRALLDDEAKPELVETPGQRQQRLYARAQKKMSFAPHMYRREDQADMYRQAAELFRETGEYEDAEELLKVCRKKAKKHRPLYIEETYARINEQLAGAKTRVDCQKLRENIEAIADYKDMEEMRRSCDALEQRLLKKERIEKFLKIFLSAVVLLVLVAVIIYVEESIHFL